MEGRPPMARALGNWDVPAGGGCGGRRITRDEDAMRRFMRSLLYLPRLVQGPGLVRQPR